MEIVFEKDYEPENYDMEMDVPEHYNRVIRAFLLFLFFWQSLFRISDSAIGLMLSFLLKFFSLAGVWLNVDVLSDLAQKFPGTIFGAKKFLGRLKDQFVRYVVCPSCNKLYLFQESWKFDAGSNKKISHTCSYM